MTHSPNEAPNALDLSDIFNYVEAHEQAFLERLIDYLRRPSISAHGQGIAEVAAFLVDLLNGLGMAAQTLETAGWPMVLAQRHNVPGAPTVLLYGHYDVQPPDPLDEWLSPPFEPTIRDGRLYARGVGDNKGQHFAHILALETLLACRGQLPCNVIFLLEGQTVFHGTLQDIRTGTGEEKLERAIAQLMLGNPANQSGYGECTDNGNNADHHHEFCQCKP